MTASTSLGSDFIVDAGTAQDQTVIQSVVAVLNEHYPGWLWIVNCNVRKGLLEIVCGHLDARFGYIIHLSGVASYAMVRKAVIKGAGELLERARQPRGKLNPDRLHDLEVDFAGRPVKDWTPRGKK